VDSSAPDRRVHDRVQLRRQRLRGRTRPPGQEKGHRLIGITSAEHTAGVRPRHPSGQRQGDVADVVLDNGASFGDAVLPTGGGKACAISSVNREVEARYAGPIRRTT
jgi:hypothetical protein